MVELATTIWADGPSGTPYEPPKPQIRAWGTWIEQIITAFTSTGGLIYSSVAALNADLAKPANSMAWVFGDPVTANNGVYGKVGASGAGPWTRRTDLPFSFIVASNAGAGTPNAIQATTAIPVSPSALVLLSVAADYSGTSATVSFNGGQALTIKSNSGDDVRSLAAGSVVYGTVVGSIFRLANDEAIASLIYAARDEAIEAREGAEAARDEAAGYLNDIAAEKEVPIYATIAGMPALNVIAGLSLIRINGRNSVGDGDGGMFTSVANGSPDTFTTNSGTRTWYRVADIGFGRINIGAQPGPKSIEYFNTSLSRCSTGNHTVDFNALQAGLNSEYAVDIGGQKLEIDQTVVITKQESMLMSSIPHQRNGSGDVRRSGNIRVEADDLPILFDCRSYNHRFDGIRVNCLSTNETTRHFNFTRPTNVADVDANIEDCTFEYGLSVVRTYGRGLEIVDCEFVGTKDMAIELEWNSNFVSNGQSNDQVGTAQRAYTFRDLRQHGCKGLVKNVGAFRRHIADIIISNIQGDTGGMIFEGVLKRSLISNVQSHIHPVSAYQLDIWGGSEYSQINNFNFGGYIRAGVTRTPTTSVWMRPEQGADAEGMPGSIIGLNFSNGVIGPTKSYGMVISGGGVVDVSMDNVHFVDCAYSTQTVAIVLSQPGDGSQVIEDFSLTLDNCRFRQSLAVTNPKTSIVGGTSTANSKVYRSGTTRQVGLSVPWTAGSIQNIAA